MREAPGERGGDRFPSFLIISDKEHDFILMAEPDDPTRDNSFEAANAIPGISDNMDGDDEDLRERQPIDLDAPIEVTPAPAPAQAAPPANGTGPATVTLADAGPAASSQEVQELKDKAKQANDNYLRAMADLQNFRRRAEEERLRIIRDANERLIKELLPVLDDFDLALDHARNTESYEQLIGGVGAVQRKFMDTLGKQGVQPIPAIGEPFNAEVHEAVMLDEESEEPDETVTAELRKGYTLHDRVIRPSLVKVAKKG
jgi:molecular chaperone GrpE